MNRFKKIGCVYDNESTRATNAYLDLKKQYNIIDAIKNPNDDYDIIITLGGDGIMLRTLHLFMKKNIPIYGMNQGSIGFLLNKYSDKNLLITLNNASETIIHPLEMKVTTVQNTVKTALAVNEVSLLRESSQSAHIKISINEKVRLNSLIADGVLVCTPAGSTAYNYAAYGPILPLNSNILALTAICPFRPRRWQGALLPRQSTVKLEIQNSDKRPVGAIADYTEIRDVKNVMIHERHDIKMKILFDKDNKLEEQILKEQFMY